MEIKKITWIALACGLFCGACSDSDDMDDNPIIDPVEIAPNTVIVTYNGDLAECQVAENIASMVQVGVNKANVSVVADERLQQEVRYVLRGTAYNGSFLMDGEYKATVVLENLNLTNQTGAAIDIANGKRIKVVVPDTTVNRLVDGPGEQKACFFVNGHPEFEGGGVLELTGNSKHAFASDEYTCFKAGFGTVKVLKAKGDGLHIEQFFKMDGGTLDISGVNGDGIDVSYTKTATDSLNGQAFVNGGTIRLAVTADDTKGFKVDSIGNLTISGGIIEADVAGDGCKGISVGGNILIQQKTEVPTKIKMNVSGTTYMPGDPEEEAKCRGIRGKKDMTFDGGDIQINVTGYKAKAIKLDGNFFHKNGQIDCDVDAANM